MTNRLCRVKRSTPSSITNWGKGGALGEKIPQESHMKVIDYLQAKVSDNMFIYRSNCLWNSISADASMDSSTWAE